MGPLLFAMGVAPRAPSRSGGFVPVSCVRRVDGARISGGGTVTDGVTLKIAAWRKAARHPCLRRVESGALLSTYVGQSSLRVKSSGGACLARSSSWYAVRLPGSSVQPQAPLATRHHSAPAGSLSRFQSSTRWRLNLHEQSAWSPDRFAGECSWFPAT